MEQNSFGFSRIAVRGRAFALMGAVAALALLATACSGDTKVTVTNPEQNGISVIGVGSVTVVPDIAIISAAMSCQLWSALSSGCVTRTTTG